MLFSWLFRILTVLLWSGSRREPFLCQESVAVPIIYEVLVFVVFWGFVFVLFGRGCHLKPTKITLTPSFLTLYFQGSENLHLLYLFELRKRTSKMAKEK